MEGPVTFTDSQFDELKKLAKSFLRVSALGSIKTISRDEMEKNTWLLYSAGFTQPEIELILDIDQSTVSKILSGKLKRKRKEESQT